MKRKIIFICTAAWLLVAVPLTAQPKARERQKEEQKGPEISVRARINYPRSKSIPEDVIWMREIYRDLDLEKSSNGALYYPVEPAGDKMNLFTRVFKLLAENKIPAYEYLLDGTEQLTPDNRMRFRDILERFRIHFEAKRESRDTTYVVHNSDIPSADVLSYFIKEVWYFDQRTSTYGSVITAICPVMHRAEEFSYEKLKLPMFWIDYQDLAPYLADSGVMTSNLNNVSNRNIGDFFISRLYDGDIYKTTNMRNLTLAQYAGTDSALVKEQKRIESELKAFEANLYGTDFVNPDDSIANSAGKKNSKNAAKEKNRGSKSSSKESSAPKASVRRERRE